MPPRSTTAPPAAAPVQVRAAGAVADVAVGSDEIARGVVHAEPRERLPVDVVQGAGRGRAGQVMYGQDVGVAAAYAGELVGVPVAGRAAQQQVEAWRGQRFTQPG